MPLSALVVEPVNDTGYVTHRAARLMIPVIESKHLILRTYVTACCLVVSVAVSYTVSQLQPITHIAFVSTDPIRATMQSILPSGTIAFLSGKEIAERNARENLLLPSLFFPEEAEEATSSIEY